MVVSSAAMVGNTIIVGRGGVAITRDMHPSLHIKLYAPIEWRLQTLMSRYHASREHMMKEINSIDLKRHRMVSQILKGSENVDNLYDLHINCSTVNHKQIVAMILKLAEEDLSDFRILFSASYGLPDYFSAIIIAAAPSIKGIPVVFLNPAFFNNCDNWDKE
jgi:cytidylate kinase